MDYFQNCRLRWNVPLKTWLISCFVLAIVFSITSGLSTIAAVKKYGISVEANPVARMLFENLGPAPGLILMETTGFIALAIILFRVFYRYHFLALFWVHSMVIMFFLVWDLCPPCL